jgi:hypothetical protein
MTANLIALPFRPTINLRGGIEPGAILEVYASGTLTPVQIFSDEALATPLPNPLTADAFGVFPDVYFDDTQLIRLILKQANGTVLSDTDPYVSDAGTAESFAAAAGASAELAATFSGPLYLSIAAGLAATDDGDEFAVDNLDGTATIYLNNGGSEVIRRVVIIAPAASGTSGLLGHIAGGTGAVTRTVQGKLREQAVSPQDFMDAALQTKVALRTATSADAAAIGAAIQAAVNTGEAVYFPNGKYYVSDAVICDNPGQVLFGESRQGAVIHVPASFNLSASGVFVCDVVEPSPEFRTFGITFEQPDTAVRGNLIAFPPAIDAQGQARLRMIGMRIIAAMTAVDLRGNAGGALIEDLQVSSLLWAVRIDGSLDSIRLGNLHHWPFGLTTDQISIFFDTSNGGVQSGLCDDLHIDNALFIGGGKQLQLVNTGAGSTFGRVTNSTFDTHAEIDMADGNVAFTGCFFTSLPTGKSQFKITGGFARLIGCNLQCNTAFSVPMVLADGNCRLIATGNTFRVPGDMTIVRAVAASGSADVILADNDFDLPLNTAFSSDVISIGAGGRASINGNKARDKGTGAGNLIGVAADNWHIITGNAFLGWGMALPASWSQLIAQDNSGVAQGDFIANRFVGKSYHARYIATADGSGNASITHGISAGNLKALDVRAAFKGGSGEWTPCTVAFVDGAQISVTGAGAGARVRAFLTYTETQDAW